MPWRLTLEGVPTSLLEEIEDAMNHHLEREGLLSQYAIASSGGTLTVTGPYTLFLDGTIFSICSGIPNFAGLRIQEVENKT